MAWWLPFGRVPEVSPDELARALASDRPPQLLDVRTHREWLAGHIEGALHASILDLPARLPSLPLERDRPVVAICLSAHRSVPAVRLLRGAGFADVSQLAGGMKAWRRAGLPETKP